ncbi:hypothetical protein CCACVL1_14576 [Corchorus capsularis]|uniref:Uncharacterized protein n=1 Tax=Corchorus capsularis TaxID=210143 RepID=A0A1R3I6H2_COCAP|nr:hypothetical protein CCACVL1_14576 [Corchorus capsularis]
MASKGPRSWIEHETRARRQKDGEKVSLKTLMAVRSSGKVVGREVCGGG